jgi:hypothetical protein
MHWMHLPHHNRYIHLNTSAIGGYQRNTKHTNSDSISHTRFVANSLFDLDAVTPINCDNLCRKRLLTPEYRTASGFSGS